MQNFLEIFLGILTAMGGFVEIGELVFSLNGGAKFGYSLLWVVVLGTIGIIVYGEMAGRVAAVTGQPVFHLIRQRAGYVAGLGTLVAATLVSLMTCAAEIGGVALIIQLMLGAPYRLLVLVACVFLLTVVWVLSFQWIERLFGLLGLLMAVFLAAAVWVDPHWSEMAKGLVPNIPEVHASSDYLVYGYFVVALVSSIMLPYETYFYAAGAIEDEWTSEETTLNRVIVVVGFTLGSLIATALIVIGAEILRPAHIEPQLPGSAALGAARVFGKTGLLVGLCGMFFAFGGAAVENALSGAYNVAHFFGWPWGKFRKPRVAARFTLTWIAILLLATAIIATGIDPVNVVEYSIVFAILTLPLSYLPLLLVARDERYMREFANGRAINFLGWFYLAVTTIAGVAAIPLLVLTRGGKG